MIVHRRHADGSPCDVTLTACEAVVSEIHSNLMDAGHSQGDALILLRGARTPEGLRSPGHNEVLDQVLTAEFAAWLAD